MKKLKNKVMIAERIKYILLLTILLLVDLQNIFAQTDCSKDLKESQTLYETGQYLGVIEKISRALNSCPLSGQEKQSAMKMLITCYLELDELEKAKELILLFLKDYPTYAAYTTDPYTFTNELKKYSIEPKLAINLRFGSNHFLPNVINTNKVWDAFDYSAEYQSEYGLSTSVYMQYYLKPNITVDFGTEYLIGKYKREISNKSAMTMTFNEKDALLHFPLIISYIFLSKKKFQPTISGGIYLEKLISSKGNLGVIAVGTDGLEVMKQTIKDISLLNNRNKINGGAILGIGCNYLQERLIFNASILYSIGFNNFTRYRNPLYTDNQIFDMYYIEDMLKAKYVSLNLGVAYRFSYKIKSKY